MIKKFNSFLKEDFGILDKVRKPGDKIEIVLKQHGYNSASEFTKDVEKINSYVEILGTDNLSDKISIVNILSVYKYKQEYGDLFEVVDELNLLLLEMKDEGMQIDIKFNSNFNPKQGLEDMLRTIGPTGQIYTTSKKKKSLKDRRNFLIKIKPKVMDVSSLNIISGVLGEAEGRGDIKFNIYKLEDGILYLILFIDDEIKEPDPENEPERRTVNRDNWREYEDYFGRRLREEDPYGEERGRPRQGYIGEI